MFQIVKIFQLNMIMKLVLKFIVSTFMHAEVERPHFQQIAFKEIEFLEKCKNEHEHQFKFFGLRRLVLGIYVLRYPPSIFEHLW